MVLLHTFEDGKFHLFLKNSQPENCPSETCVKIDVVSVLTKQHLLIRTVRKKIFGAFC